MNIDRRLIAGDFFVLLAFCVGGIVMHDMTDNWPRELVRILIPFVLGYFGVAAIIEVWAPTRSGLSFILSTLALWTLGVTVGLALRSLLEGSVPLLSFVVVTYLFTGIMLISWRVVYWLTIRVNTQKGPDAER